MRLLSDDKDFLGILDQHKRIIFKICNSYCRNPESRKDLVQEVVIQLWKSYPKYDPQYKISTWIYRIALNVAISFYRREEKFKRHNPVSEALIVFKDDPESNDEVENNLRLLQAFINELKEIDKAIILLYLDDKPYREIAEITGFTETNVATKINRIKEKLRTNFLNQ